MKVFVAGATGVLGSALVPRLRARGHSVVALAHRPENDERLRALGALPARADIFDADTLARAAAGCEAVIHAATAIPTAARPDARAWAVNDRLRREGTQALTQCAARVGARLYLQQSVVWVARPSDGGDFDEDAPPNPTRITQSALDGERIAHEAAARAGFTCAVVRGGWFYGPASAHTRRLGEGLRRRHVPIVGNGEAVWACVHVDDAAAAYCALLDAPRAGIWHAVDDTPVSVRAFLTDFAARLHAPPPRRITPWLARLIAGRYAAEFFTRSTRTSNAKLKRETAWRPRYPSYREGLDQVVDAWRREGFGR